MRCEEDTFKIFMKVAFDGSTKSLMEKVICETMSWINENLDVDLHAKSVAAKSGYTKWYFQRRFKEITGMTLSHYILMCRAVAAREEILSTDKSFTDIAFNNGFNSQQTFSRAVRTIFNMSPTEIRSSRQ